MWVACGRHVGGMWVACGWHVGGMWAACGRQEKKLLVEIKKTAKTGNQAAARVLARELVRVRAQIAKLHKSKAQIRGISTHAQ
ncbi:unnamed protein product, partial [Closterium sp. NIES-53]